MFGSSLASSFRLLRAGAAPNVPDPRSQIREAANFRCTNDGAPVSEIRGAVDHGAARNYRRMPPPKSQKNGSLLFFLARRHPSPAKQIEPLVPSRDLAAVGVAEPPPPSPPPPRLRQGLAAAATLAPCMSCLVEYTARPGPTSPTRPCGDPPSTDSSRRPSTPDAAPRLRPASRPSTTPVRNSLYRTMNRRCSLQPISARKKKTRTIHLAGRPNNNCPAKRFSLG